MDSFMHITLNIADAVFKSVVRKPSAIQFLYFEDLHRKNIEALENRLKSPGDTDHNNLHDLLHKYCEALDDFEKMAIKPKIKAKSGDSPLPTGTMMVGMRWEEEERKARFEGVLGSIVGTFITFLFALTGGLALIVPMLIMVLSPSKKTSLITTCIFVFVFATALALYSTIITYLESYSKSRGDLFKGSRIQGKDILAATAAYAAVLVVFVGTNASTST